MKYPLMAAAAVLAFGVAAQAQAQPAPEAPATAAQSFSDADLTAFARAAIAASKIQQDASIADADKQPKMLAAVQAEGLDPVKFNSIAQASQADPELHKRIQALANADAAARQAPAGNP